MTEHHAGPRHERQATADLATAMLGRLRGHPRERSHAEDHPNGDRAWWRCVPLDDAVQAAHDAALAGPEEPATAWPAVDCGYNGLHDHRVTGGYVGPFTGPHPAESEGPVTAERLGVERLRKVAARTRDLLANYLWNEDDSGDDSNLEAAYDRLRDLLGPSTEEGIGKTLAAVYDTRMNDDTR